MPVSSPRQSHSVAFHPYSKPPLLPKQTTTTTLPTTPLPPLPPMPASLTSAAPLLRRSAKAEETTKTISTASGDLLLSTFQVKLPPPPPSAKKSETKESKTTKTPKPAADLEVKVPQNVSKRVLQNRKAQKRFRIRRQEHLKDLEKRAELLEEAYSHIDQLKNINSQLIGRLQQFEQFIRVHHPDAFGPSSSATITSTITAPIATAVTTVPTITYQPVGTIASSPVQPSLDGHWRASDTLSDSDLTDFDSISAPNSPLNINQNLGPTFLKQGFVDPFNTTEFDPEIWPYEVGDVKEPISLLSFQQIPTE